MAQVQTELLPSLRMDPRSTDHYLQLLGQCPDITSPVDDLKQLTEHAYNLKAHNDSKLTPEDRLTQYVNRRSEGEPLEYIVGHTLWSGMDILCRSGTLIPRASSDRVAAKFAKSLSQLQPQGVVKSTEPIKIADVGTGTGCTSLLLHLALKPPNTKVDAAQSLEIYGGDISSDCLKLAADNLKHNVQLGSVDKSAAGDISFGFMDMIKLGEVVRQLEDNVSPAMIKQRDADSMKFLEHKWDVMISYPPCVPADDFLPGGRVPYTDRTYQPKVAIVPPVLAKEVMEKLEDPADIFYHILLKVAIVAEVKALVLEVCEGPQATRVRKMAAEAMPEGTLIERWRDDRVWYGEGLKESDEIDINDDEVHGRAIVVWSADWAEWRKRSHSTA